MLAVYSGAYCAVDSGLYQIRIPSASSISTFLTYRVLSSLHSTEAEAWHYAALRLRIDQRAKANLDENKAVVVEAYPRAYSATIHGHYYQIRRPRVGSDKPSPIEYVPLSGRYSTEPFAWQEAASSMRRKHIASYGDLKPPRILAISDYQARRDPNR